MTERFKVSNCGSWGTFRCPGCNSFHTVALTGPGLWTWNGLKDLFTLNPSVLVTSGHYMAGHQGPNCWCTMPDDEDPEAFHCYRCHSFIRDGQIEFLSDSTHKLAGKTVAVPPYERTAAHE